MGEPIVISDEEDQKTPLSFLSKKRRTSPDAIPTFLISDSDPTPQKPPGDAAAASLSTPSFVAETPMSDGVSVVKCSVVPLDTVSTGPDCNDKFSGKRVISLESESENESESGYGGESSKKNETVLADLDEGKYGWHSSIFESTTSLEESVFSGEFISSLLTELADIIPPENDCDFQEHGVDSLLSNYLLDEVVQVDPDEEKENFSFEQMGNTQKQRKKPKANNTGEALGKKKMTKEERILAMEEKKLKKQQERLQKAALKAEAVERKKLEKEKQKWERGKLALKSIVAEIDAKVVELGSVGGYLLSRFSEKGITFRVTSNPIERSIVWTMTIPEQISQLFPQGPKIPYVLLVYEADEFCNLANRGSLLEHVSKVRSQYPSYTVCYLTNKLMQYINKREKELYKKPENFSGWRRPPIEEVLAKLTTHYTRVHSRHCVDEAELAEHVVGLTCSLACCQFRKKLTRLSVSANGSIIPKDSVDKDLIKKNLWLKSLIAIPKVQPRFAVAVWKKYPTMKSLLRVYMDPNKSVHEKEFLLKELTVEGLVGDDRRLGEVCSKRIYRVLMAQSGSIRTDDVEVGADFFRQSEV